MPLASTVCRYSVTACCVCGARTSSWLLGCRMPQSCGVERKLTHFYGGHVCSRRLAKARVLHLHRQLPPVMRRRPVHLELTPQKSVWSSTTGTGSELEQGLDLHVKGRSLVEHSRYHSGLHVQSPDPLPLQNLHPSLEESRFPLSHPPHLR